MQALQALIPVLVTLSLAGLVLSVGLHATVGDVTYVVRRPALLLKAILAVIVIPPVAAGILISLAPLDPMVKAAIMVMAISPVPPLVPGKELAAGGRKEYAYGLYVAMVLLTIISVPLVLFIAAAIFGHDAQASFSSIAKIVFGGAIAPLALGMLIRSIAPDFAERYWRLVYKMSTLLLLAVFVPILIKTWPAVSSMIGNGAVLAMAAVIMVALMAGHFLGGPDRRDRASLAIAAGVRHPGIAMSLATASFDDNRVKAAVVLFLLVGILVSAPYTAWIKRSTAHA